MYNKDKSVDTLLMDPYGKVYYKNKFYKGSLKTRDKLRSGIIDFPTESIFEMMRLRYGSTSVLSMKDSTESINWLMSKSN